MGDTVCAPPSLVRGHTFLVEPDEKVCQASTRSHLVTVRIPSTVR